MQREALEEANTNISITTDSGKEKEKFPEKEDVLKVIQAKLE